MARLTYFMFVYVIKLVNNELGLHNQSNYNLDYDIGRHD